MKNNVSVASIVHDPVGQGILETVQKADYYNRWIFNLIKPHLKSEIIEIGSGIGSFTKLLVQDKFKVTATDYNQIYLNNLTNDIHNVSTFFFDLTSQSAPRALLNRFDTAICFNVLEHISTENQALQNIKNTLKSGGKLIILVPAFQFAFGNLDRDLGHFRRYTKKRLSTALNRNGFTIESSRYINPLGLIGWWINALFKRSTISPWQIWMFDIISRPLLLIEKYIPSPFGLSLIAIAHT